MKCGLCFLLLLLWVQCVGAKDQPKIYQKPSHQAQADKLKGHPILQPKATKKPAKPAKASPKVASPKPSTPPDPVFEKAMQLYQARKYKEAAQYYQKLLQTHSTANLHYNLAHALSFTGDIPQALLHYQRARFLDAQLKGLEQSQSYILRSISYSIQDLWKRPKALEMLDRLADILGPAASHWIVTSSLWSVLIFLLARKLFKLPARGLRVLSALAICLGLLGLSGSIAWHLRAKEGIVQHPATLLAAPAATAPVLRQLPAGSPAHLQLREGDFVEIKLFNGLSGWIAAPSFETILD